jgi:hypothetical protein
MRYRWLLVVLAGLLIGLTGCGGDAPAPKPLTAEEEKQFEEQRQKDRDAERRVKQDG